MGLLVAPVCTTQDRRPDSGDFFEKYFVKPIKSVAK